DQGRNPNAETLDRDQVLRSEPASNGWSIAPTAERVEVAAREPGLAPRGRLGVVTPKVLHGDLGAEKAAEKFLTERAHAPNQTTPLPQRRGSSENTSDPGRWHTRGSTSRIRRATRQQATLRRGC